MILVTGGTGMVGAHLLYQLVLQGEQVRAIHRPDSSFEGVKTVFGYYSNTPDTLFKRIEWVVADITDIPELTNAFKGISRVYHLAAMISFNPSQYRLLRKFNIEGTANIVNLCIDHNVTKLCYVSSIATLSSETKNKPIDEESHWNPEEPHTIYAITKFGAEMEVWRGTQEGLNAVIVNPSVILGAGFWLSGSGKIFGKAKKGIPFYTRGEMGFVDVEDVAMACIMLMNSPIINERFILNSENWSYKRLLQTITQRLNTPVPKLELKPWILQIGWRLDWFFHTFFRTRRKLTKRTAATLINRKYYNNSKNRTTIRLSL